MSAARQTQPSTASSGLEQIQVAQYYDQNTARFLRFGGSKESAAIHRQIWAPGVQNTAHAFQYLNQLVADAIQPALRGQQGQLAELPPLSKATVLDLGCGVGGTATWLAQRLDVIVVGVTNSAIQATLARQRAERSGLGERCHFIQADFMELPTSEQVNAAYAIESFAHAPNGPLFFEQVAALLAHTGRLVMCDDFLAEICTPANQQTEPRAAAETSTAAAYWLRRFQKGWHIHHLTTPSAARQMAQAAGLSLVESRDLTPYLRCLHPTLLRAAAWATRLPPGSSSSAYWQNLSGGMALQMCIQRGWTVYLAQVYEKD
jgi:2-polyprenyl-3-methyl-5-hydroxy-6-metoxy-1,4-benzoquinol methylase